MRTDVQSREALGSQNNDEDLSPAEELGPLVVVICKGSAPGVVRDIQHGEAEIEYQHPNPEVKSGDVPWVRDEYLIDGEHDHGYGQCNPVLVLPPSTAVSVDNDTHDGVGHQVPDACDGKDQANGRETETQAPAIERRQIDGNRHAHRPDGQCNHGVAC